MSHHFDDPAFSLDARLEQDTQLVESWSLCDVRIMNESRYPWFILVPRIAGLKELYELSSEQRAQFDQESDRLSRAVMTAFHGEKLNVAALGNVVSQLHIHHIVRYQSDPAWPAPVWGKFPVQGMTQAELTSRLEQLRPHLEPAGF